MKPGIKGRLVWSYLLLIVLTVALFEILILSALKFYYVEGIKQTIKDQGAMFVTFHEQELSEGALADKAPVLLQRYTFNLDAQVQIFDSGGTLLADTHEILNYAESSKDVEEALSGVTGFFGGYAGKEKVLSVAQPLKIDGNILGAIRMTTSMEQADSIFKQNMLALMGIGFIVILITAWSSHFLAITITKPLGVITAAAEQMASGRFSARIAKTKEDELGKLADTLNFMAEEVERHEKLKNEFIASVSHELRTPLTSVKGWAITLQSMSEEKVFKEGLEIISEESERLSNMLGDLLDLSRLSAGKTEYKFERLNLALLLQQIISQLTPRAHRLGIQLIGKADGEVVINGDSDRLKQVFLNVLDNSLKFTDSGGCIFIRLKASGNMAKVEIEDTGEGIPEEEIDSVKKKFHKGNSKASGTGLGLAICQEIIQAHEGSFELRSRLHEGTVVGILLPRLES